MSKTEKAGKVLVGVLMGSDSDWPVMRLAVEALTEFGVGSEARVMSAHRTPGDVAEYARGAAGR
ncbi:MAG: AIR carboxylase family protein, partial [Verrucomicrobiia bacterium]